MRRKPLLSMVAVLVATSLAPASVVAATCPDPPPVDTAAASASSMANRVATNWQALQRDDGTFEDYISKGGKGRDHYGPAMMGAGLVLNGIRTCRPAVTHAGLRAIEWAARHPWRTATGAEHRGVLFENLALAVAYEEAHDHLAGDSVYEGMRATWETRLRTMRLMVYGQDLPYYNWYLVETLTVAALLQSGLHSTVAGSILADPAAVRDTITSYLNSVVLQEAGAQTTTFGDQAVLLLSDPPDNPPAYHELSLALFAKSVALLGADAEASARTVLDRMGRATWALMAPDGDVSWFGRSQEQSWTLAMTAAGLLTTSRVQGIQRPDAERLRAAATRALQRLGSPDYSSRRYGLWIAPAVAGDAPRRALGGLDRYAAAASYTGLTLLGLEWVAEDPNAKQPDPGVGIASDVENMGLRLANSGSFIIERSPTTWMSVKQAPAKQKHYVEDLRYESGLNGLEVLAPGGSWQRVLPPRPLTAHAKFDASGPVLHRGRLIGRAVGRTLRIDGQAIVMQADYVTARGGRVSSRRIVRYEPLSCGVKITVRALAGEVWEYSAFFAGAPRRAGHSTVADSTQRISAAGPSVNVAHSAGQTYQSGENPHLVRWRVRAGHAHNTPVSFTVCATQ